MKNLFDKLLDAPFETVIAVGAGIGFPLCTAGIIAVIVALLQM